MVGRHAEIGLAGQALALRAYVPEARPKLARGRLLWVASVTPTPTSMTYRLQLEAVAHREARLFVLDPHLVRDADGRLPHVYLDGSLCLNVQNQWRPHMLFTDTVLPWAMQWLVFYELWRTTGVWYGDGDVHLDPGSQQALLHPYDGPTSLDFAWTRVRARRAMDTRRLR